MANSGAMDVFSRQRFVRFLLDRHGLLRRTRARLLHFNIHVVPQLCRQRVECYWRRVEWYLRRWNTVLVFGCSSLVV